MEKANLGISVTLFGAGICLMGLFSNYTVMLLLLGYVLLKEESEWLKKTVLKVLAIMMAFSFASVLVNLIPSGLNVLNDFLGIFGGYWSMSAIRGIFNTVDSILVFVERILFICLSIKAFKQETIAVPFVDKLLEKYI